MIKIEKSKYKMVCDLAGCHNIAEYSVRHEGQPLGRGITICGSCLQEMLDAAYKNGIKPSNYEKDVHPVVIQSGFEKFNFTQLKGIAKELKVINYTKYNRDELIKAIEQMGQKQND